MILGVLLENTWRKNPQPVRTLEGVVFAEMFDYLDDVYVRKDADVPVADYVLDHCARTWKAERRLHLDTILKEAGYTTTKVGKDESMGKMDTVPKEAGHTMPTSTDSVNILGLKMSTGETLKRVVKEKLELDEECIELLKSKVVGQGIHSLD